MSKLENKIRKLEKEKEDLVNRLYQMTYGTKEYITACTRLTTVEKSLTSEMEEWERLMEDGQI